MLNIQNPIVWLVGAIAGPVVWLVLRGHFSTESRERRRERSHRAMVSRKQGPTVKLAVKVDKPKRDGKG